ncbi:MAG TPA: Mpo1-like protein [Kofleriaceae bacterium]|nr:Mpo1-like protein [Kofleriaceae bacterium]
MTPTSTPTTTSERLYASKSFGEFWERYQEIHAHPRTRAMHALATASALGMVALAVARRNPKLALLAPVVDYGIAQLSHRSEGQRTQPLRKPLWHARAEWRLFRKSLVDAEHYLHSRW